MRRLILLRHSKAVGAAAAGDHARALSARGVADAAEAGVALMARIKPGLALVSDARRTRETFDRVVEVAGRDIPHRFERALYGASPEEILAVVAGVAIDERDIMVVGHNPGLGDLARHLSRRGPAGPLANLGARFPTSAFAVIGLPGTDWSETRDGTLEAFVTVDSSQTSD